ncbi:MAG: hypothetical protein AAF846_20570 [Chloroflexota bacterium]
MRDRKWQRRLTIGIGFFLAFIMVASLLTPIFLTNQQIAPQQARPTNTPVPTQPAPPDTTSIFFDRTYLHPSGLFTAAIPSGYVLNNELNNTGEAQAAFENAMQLSVLELRALRPAGEISLDSAENLGDFFTEDWLRTSWNRYSTWNEDARRVENDQLVMDFSLTRSGQEFAARQVAYTDGTWIYTVRVVAPTNASEAIQYILENEVASFSPIERFVGSDMEWNAYFDDVANHLVRFPGDWIVVDGADGVPASVSAPNAQLRIETTDTTVDSVASAEQYVAGLQSNITVLSTSEIEQDGNAGYRVAYTQSSLDGASQSGIVQFVTTDTTTHVVNILLTDVSDVDLNTVDTTAEDANPTLVSALGILDTFSILPDLEIDNS